MSISKIIISELGEIIQDFVETTLAYEEVTGSGLKPDRTIYEYLPNQFIRRVCSYKDAHDSKKYIITFEIVQQPKNGTEDHKCFMDLMGRLEDTLPRSLVDTGLHEDIFNLIGKWVPLVVGANEKLTDELVRKNTEEILFSSPDRQSESKEPHPSQIAKINCRAAAKKLWAEHPKITIADMIDREELIEYTTKKDGSLYTTDTVRNWIKDLCPDRSPGRRPAKK